MVLDPAPIAEGAPAVATPDMARTLLQRVHDGQEELASEVSDLAGRPR